MKLIFKENGLSCGNSTKIFEYFSAHMLYFLGMYW